MDNECHCIGRGVTCWNCCHGQHEQCTADQHGDKNARCSRVVESSTPPRGFEDWLREGIEKCWCGPPVCSTHDGTPTTADEDAAFDGGDDVCIHVIRPYKDAETKIAVEDNHHPSVWRNTYSRKEVDK